MYYIRRALRNILAISVIPLHFLNLPEAITESETLDEALFNAAEVLTLALEGRMDEGLTIPMPSDVTEISTIYHIAPSLPECKRRY